MTETGTEPDPVAILKALIACRSVTPAEGGALAYLASALGDAGFTVERLAFAAPGTADVENLFATIGRIRLVSSDRVLAAILNSFFQTISWEITTNEFRAMPRHIGISGPNISDCKMNASRHSKNMPRM